MSYYNTFYLKKHLKNITIYEINTINMSYPDSITIDDVNYYNAHDLEKYDPEYFEGCQKTVRKIIDKMNIDISNVAYGNYNKRYGWRLSANQIKPPQKANLLLKKEWVLKNVPNMIKNKNKKNKKKQPKEEIREAPPLLELEEHEMFHDDEDNAYEIETRGERTVECVYFLASDVSKAFEMKSLIKNLKDRKGTYTKNIDYKFFTHSSGKKYMYCTYEGMLRILYSSRSNKAKTFRKWATNVLFTVQMGTKEQKQELAAGLIGIPAQTLKNVLSKSVSDISCIYRFVLGESKNLRHSMNIPIDIPDNYLIIKYGLTKNLVRRTGEHMKTYGNIKGVKLELMNFAYIDPKYISKAEIEIKEFFGDIETFIQYKKNKELVAVNPKHNRQIKNLYRNIKDEYGGCVKRLNDTIDSLKRDIKAKDIEIKNMKKYHLLEIKTNNKDNEISALKKDLEIARLKNELLQLKQN